MKFGIIIASHVPEIAAGVKELISQAAPSISITTAGGTDDNELGTSITKIQKAIEENKSKELLAFYDLGSAKMNLDMAITLSDKVVHLYDASLVEGAYTAASLSEVGVDLDTIEKQLSPLIINK